MTVPIDATSSTTVEADSYCQEMLRGAQAELGAFQEAVRRRFGDEVAVRAGDIWLEELEAADCKSIVHWRSVTIRTASQLAKALGFPQKSDSDAASGTGEVPSARAARQGGGPSPEHADVP